MQKRLVGMGCLMAAVGLTMGAQQAQAGQYEIDGQANAYYFPLNPVSLTMPGEDGNSRDGVYVAASGDGATASGSASATEFSAAGSGAASSVEGGNAFAANYSGYANVLRLTRWNWVPDADEDAAPYQVSAPGIDVSYDVEAANGGDDDHAAGAVAAGNISTAVGLVASDTIALDGTDVPIYIMAMKKGDHPHLKRPSAPYAVEGSGAGNAEITALQEASSKYMVYAVGPASATITKQEAKFGELTCAIQAPPIPAP